MMDISIGSSSSSFRSNSGGSSSSSQSGRVTSSAADRGPRARDAAVLAPAPPQSVLKNEGGLRDRLHGAPTAPAPEAAPPPSIPPSAWLLSSLLSGTGADAPHAPPVQSAAATVTDGALSTITAAAAAAASRSPSQRTIDGAPSGAVAETETSSPPPATVAEVLRTHSDPCPPSTLQRPSRDDGRSESPDADIIGVGVQATLPLPRAGAHSPSAQSSPHELLRLQLPSRSLDAVATASLSQAAGRRASMESDEAPPRRHASWRRPSDSHRRSSGSGELEDVAAASTSVGFTEMSAARPPSLAPAPMHPSAFLTLAALADSHGSRSRSGGGAAAGQLLDEPLAASESMHVSSPVATSPSPSPSPSLPVAASLPSLPTATAAAAASVQARDDITGGGEERRRLPPRSTRTAPTQRHADTHLPVSPPAHTSEHPTGSSSSSSSGSVERDRRGVGGAVATESGESPPPLPPAPWRTANGGPALDSDRHERRSSSPDVHTDAQSLAPRRTPPGGGEGDHDTRAVGGQLGQPPATPTADDREDGCGGAALHPRRLAHPAAAAGASGHRQPRHFHALERWRSRGSLVGGAATEVAPPRSPSPTAARTPSARGGSGVGHSPTSPFTGGVDLVRWMPSSVSLEADLSGASLTPPSARRGGDRAAAHHPPPRVVAVPLVALPRRTTPPPEEATRASAVLAAVAHRHTSPAATPSPRRGDPPPAEAAGAATAVPRPRLRLSTITSSAQERQSSRCVAALGRGDSTDADQRRGRGAARGSCVDGAAGRASAGPFGNSTPPSPPHRQATPVGASLSPRSSLAALLAPRTARRCLWSATRETSDDAERESDASEAVTGRWRQLGLVDNTDELGGDHTCHRRWEHTTLVSSRSGAGLHSSSASPRITASGGRVPPTMSHSGGLVNTGVGLPRRVLSIEASSLTSSSWWTSEPPTLLRSDGQLEAHPAHVPPAATAVGARGDRVRAGPAMSPGYTAVYSPRLLATRVLEMRDTLLGGSRAVPAVGAAVAAAAARVSSLDGGVQSRSPSPTYGTPHLCIDLSGPDVQEGHPPRAAAPATATPTPWSLASGGAGVTEASPLRRASATAGAPSAQRHSAVAAAAAAEGTPGTPGAAAAATPPLPSEAAPTQVSSIVRRTTASSAPLSTASVRRDPHSSFASSAWSRGEAPDVHGRPRLSPDFAATHADGAAAETSDGCQLRERQQPVPQSHLLAQARLLHEEAVRRRQICMLEEHRFVVEVTELNYTRAVEYVRYATGTTLARVSTRASPPSNSASAAPLEGLSRVRQDQRAMAATLNALTEELAVVSP